MSDTRQEQDVKADNLGEQIDGLLDHMESAADDVARELMGEASPNLSSPAVPDPAPEHDNDTIPQPSDEASEKDKPQIDTTPQPADTAPADTKDKPEIDTTPQPADAVPTDAALLDQQVGTLVDSAMESAEQPEPSIPTDIDSLDDELAALANDLLAGSDEQVDGAITDASPPVDQPAKTVPAPATPVADAPSPTPPVVEPPAEAAPEPSVETIEQPEPAPPVQKREAPKFAALGTAIKAIEFTGRPLANKPDGFRQTVGWIALITLFNATIAWTYVLFIREPVQPVANQTPATLTVPQDAAPTSIND